MITEGMIYLYKRCGELVRARRYASVSKRLEIIKSWKKIYSPAINKCFIQIAPEVNEQVSESGENKLNRA